MKLKNIFLPMLTAFVCMAMTTSCDSDDEWTPGPQAVNEYQVYFTTQSEDAGEVEKGEAVDFSVTITRPNSTKAAAVPLTVTGNRELFEVPATIDFAEGESTKTFNVHFKGTEQLDDYQCTITIDDPEFSSPYTTHPISVTLKLMVAKWEVVSDSVHFYSYNNYTPDFDVQLLKIEGKQIYRFTNFMKNFNLTFNVKAFGSDGSYYILPNGGFYAPDWFEWGYENCWHMGDDADNTWALYYNGDNSGGYYAWCFFFSGAETSGSTYINFNKKTGCIMWDFSYYDANDNYVNGNWDYLMFNWK